MRLAYDLAVEFVETLSRKEQTSDNERRSRPMSDRTIEIRKLGYSRSPWRLVDSETGKEVAFEQTTFDHPWLGATDMPVVGYDTKRDAVAALGRLAAQNIERGWR